MLNPVVDQPAEKKEEDNPTPEYPNPIAEDNEHKPSTGEGIEEKKEELVKTTDVDVDVNVNVKGNVEPEEKTLSGASESENAAVVLVAPQSAQEVPTEPGDQDQKAAAPGKGKPKGKGKTHISYEEVEEKLCEPEGHPQPAQTPPTETGAADAQETDKMQQKPSKPQTADVGIQVNTGFYLDGYVESPLGTDVANNLYWAQAVPQITDQEITDYH